MNGDEKFIKVLFDETPHEWKDSAAEGLWCIALGDGTARVDNIPWFVSDLAVGDIVRIARVGDDFVSVGVVRRSGHSTFLVAMTNGRAGEKQFLERWQYLAAYGCTYEGTGTGHFAIDVPSAACCSNVIAILEKGSHDGTWKYFEGYCATE